ncbi:AI-2E family transporter [uncultured Roseobacter sp.]|uniref:AI-2E family transporter n=1 Tax=uncultured Roseobacter sp. TaxID=114847 RepID=UPI002638FE9D|nr:AI-2E family transporter [uncultured Roseobacter sp.]
MREDIKALRRSVSTLTTITIFVIAYFARDLILPVMLGCLIALTLSPINRYLQKQGLPAAVSAVTLILLAAGSIAAIIFFAGDTVRTWSDDAPNIARELKYKLSGVTEAIDAVKDASSQVEEMTAASAGGPQAVVVQQPGLLNSAVTLAASSATSISVALILALFLLASGDLFYVKLVQAFPTFSAKKHALTMVYDIERRVSGYLLTITLINAGLGVIIASALWLVGLEYAYIWGIAAFLLNYLPILGGLIGTLLVAVHAIIYFDSFSYALLAPLLYQALTAFEAQFVTPYLVSKRLELNTVAVFLTVVLWAWLWGVAGALVAVPFLLVFKVICDKIDSLKVIGNFLGAAEAQTRPEP